MPSSVATSEYEKPLKPRLCARRSALSRIADRVSFPPVDLVAATRTPNHLVTTGLPMNRPLTLDTYLLISKSSRDVTALPS